MMKRLQERETVPRAMTELFWSVIQHVFESKWLVQLAVLLRDKTEIRRTQDAGM